MDKINPSYLEFYDGRRESHYGLKTSRPEQHPHFEVLRRFIEDHDLHMKRCLEIGSSTGIFQDMVDDYWGTDVTEVTASFYHKPYRVARGDQYPFEDQMFDAIWTITVYEHIPNLQQALLEVKRLLKSQGYCLFSPAWQCRVWAAEGYAVRPWRDLAWKGKVIKASIPIRDSVLFRSVFIFPKRLYRLVMFLMGKRFKEIRYKKIKPNYEKLWTSDSDACNSIDPHDAILWFLSHGFECLSHPGHIRAFMVKTGALVFRKL
jgi:SAM-dependent methyltransferase